MRVVRSKKQKETTRRLNMDKVLTIGAGVTLGVFLLTGFAFVANKDKIVSSHVLRESQRSAQAETLPNPSTAVGDDGSNDTTESKDVSGESSERSEPSKEQDEDAKDIKDGMTSEITIAPGAVVDKKTLTKYLMKMDQSEFLTLVASVDRVIEEVPEGSKQTGARTKSLQEAYLAAEKQFAGQIDGSKRLKLVDDINAIDYTYYVAEKGDTLLYLSQSFGVPLGQLIELNGIGDADKIRAGMILLFPRDTKQP